MIKGHRSCSCIAIILKKCHYLATKSMYLESQHEAALSRLHQLEDNSRHQRQAIQEEVVLQAPLFTQPMRDIRTCLLYTSVF